MEVDDLSLFGHSQLFAGFFTVDILRDTQLYLEVPQGLVTGYLAGQLNSHQPPFVLVELVLLLIILNRLFKLREE